MHGSGIFGYGVRGGLSGGGRDEPGCSQGRDRLVGGRLFHQSGSDQRLDGGSSRRGLDPLRLSHCLGGFGSGRHRREQGVSLGGLSQGDYLGRLLHGGDLSPHHQPGLSGEETLADQRAASLSDGVKERGGPVMLDQQEGQSGPRRQRIGQRLRTGRVKGPWAGRLGRGRRDHRL